MAFRSRRWRWVAAIFALVNLGSAGFAAAAGEGIHTAVHVGLMFLGAYLVWRLAPGSPGDLARPQDADQRLEYLQESVDAIALEVERIGEAQRFTTKLLTERQPDAAARLSVPARREPGTITPH